MAQDTLDLDIDVGSETKKKTLSVSAVLSFIGTATFALSFLGNFYQHIRVASFLEGAVRDWKHVTAVISTLVSYYLKVSISPLTLSFLAYSLAVLMIAVAAHRSDPHRFDLRKNEIGTRFGLFVASTTALFFLAGAAGHHKVKWAGLPLLVLFIVSPVIIAHIRERMTNRTTNPGDMFMVVALQLILSLTFFVPLADIDPRAGFQMSELKHYLEIVGTKIGLMLKHGGPERFVILSVIALQFLLPFLFVRLEAMRNRLFMLLLLGAFLIILGEGLARIDISRLLPPDLPQR